MWLPGSRPVSYLRYGVGAAIPRAIPSAPPGMPFTLTVWPGTEVLVVRGEGAGSLAESAEVLRALERQALVPAIRAVLFDLRALDYIPTPDDAREIALRYGDFGEANKCRMAYLAPPGAQYGVARMVEMLTQQRGVAAGTFTTPDLALSWLQAPFRALGA